MISGPKGDHSKCAILVKFKSFLGSLSARENSRDEFAQQAAPEKLNLFRD